MPTGRQEGGDPDRILLLRLQAMGVKVDPKGFEPLTNGLRGRCSTVELWIQYNVFQKLLTRTSLKIFLPFSGKLQTTNFFLVN